MATSSKSVQLARCIYFLTANRWSPFVLLLIASGWGRGLFSDFDSEQWRRRRAVRRFVDTVRCLCLPTRSQPHTGTARQHASLAICHSELNPDKVKSWQSSGSVEACTTSLPRETNQPLLPQFPPRQPPPYLSRPPRMPREWAASQCAPRQGRRRRGRAGMVFNADRDGDAFPLSPRTSPCLSWPPEMCCARSRPWGLRWSCCFLFANTPANE